MEVLGCRARRWKNGVTVAMNRSCSLARAKHSISASVLERRFLSKRMPEKQGRSRDITRSGVSCRASENSGGEPLASGRAARTADGAKRQCRGLSRSDPRHSTTPTVQVGQSRSEKMTTLRPEVAPASLCSPHACEGSYESRSRIRTFAEPNV